MKLPTLYSRASTGKILEYVIEVEDNKYRTVTGYADGKKVTTEWTECFGKNIGRSNETTPAQQALSEATAKHQKKKDLGAFEHIADIDNEIHFEPMLAKKWENEKSKIKYPIYSQPKLDGIRCIVTKNGMFTRNGKPLISAPHIFESLKHLFDETPNLVLDGELYADKFANDFNAICSLVKKTKPTADDLKESADKIEYHIYDLPSAKYAFSMRFNVLQETPFPGCCKVVNTYLLSSDEEVDAKLAEYLEAGYEGQMLRLDLPYENKRSKSLLKHKQFTDEEYAIIGVEEGEGNKAGMVGAFVFENANGDTFRGSPKFGWEDCKNFWSARADLIGKSATVKYFNLTPDGIPRFPVVINIGREDYE